MSQINIAGILSVCVPDGGTCTNLIDHDCFLFGAAGGEEMRLFLFQELEPDPTQWCYSALEDHIRNSVGPPFQTSVQEVEGETWTGYQGVTALDEFRFLVNRVIASKVSAYGLRLEFHGTKDQLPETIVEMAESLVFSPSSTAH